MSGPSTLWSFEVCSPSVLLQPCSASSGSKERQTLHRVFSMGYQQGQLPAGISCIPGRSSSLQSQAEGIYHLSGWRGASQGDRAGQEDGTRALSAIALEKLHCNLTACRRAG